MKYAKSATAVFAVAAIAVALSALPSSRYLPVEFTRASKAMAVALPQGWAFFTKDPTSESQSGYVYRDKTWVPIVESLPVHDAVGISRVARAMDAEIAVLTQAADSGFSDCASDTDINDCARTAQELPYSFASEQTPLCEPILIQKIAPVPFAYGTRVGSMPSKVVIVDVECVE